ncbi:hypothetical protein H6G33_10570 [Calothrix sp. FACHB-1219]|uniref:hypothetical protein n=1 Tax=unclassified Calothrix TaxID=2619626 RepID=UPI001686DE1B|nr:MULTISPECIES: hypothetical protein [unclassified Calothrix]MBD2201791.1 hypothetical protein [Calothrix sp. FACHB-168]MBD2217477.1 hypothetical protein [Calothrix sp. FACHB-1219]
MEEKEPLEEYISAFKKLNVLLLGVFIDLVEGKEKAVFVNSNLDMIIQKPELLNQFLEFRKKVFKKYQSEIVEIFEELQKEL